MPLCYDCKKFLPPNFTDAVGKDALGNTEYRCKFCQIGQDFITVSNPGQPTKKYTKDQCEKDYKEFIAQVANKGSIKKIIDKDKNVGGVK